jgi:CubicO group peptidase (beta-lactamase class C family)
MTSEFSRRDLLRCSGAGLVSNLLPIQGISKDRIDYGSTPWLDPEYIDLPDINARLKALSSKIQSGYTSTRKIGGIPVTGHDIDSHRAFDESMVRLMQTPKIVGMSCCIAVNGKPVLTRAYGYLSSVDKIVATPISPGYVGSITKPICALTSLALVQEGRLDYRDYAADILRMDPILAPGETYQADFADVTVRMLTNHTSGIYNGVEFLLNDRTVLEQAKQKRLSLVNGEPSQWDLVRRGLATKYVAKPGTAQNYSGGALQVLGRVIERRSGRRLDKAMNAKFFLPMGIQDHRCLSYINRDQYGLIARGESAKSQTFIPSPLTKEGLAESWRSENERDALYSKHWGHADSCGASMLSAIDLLALVCRLPKVFGPATLKEMLRIEKTIPGAFNGVGWGVSYPNGKPQFGHSGKFGGIRASVEFLWDEVQYSFLFVGDDEEFYNQCISQVKTYARQLKRSQVVGLDWQNFGVG